MALISDYTAGTITVSANGTAVTGVGTAWQVAGFKEGDWFIANGWVNVVASVVSNTSLTLAQPWRGGALSGAAYRLRYMSDGSRASAQARQMIDMLGGSGNLEAIGGLVSAPNTVPYFTGPGTAALTDLTAFARTLFTAANAAAARSAIGAGTYQWNWIINGDFTVNQRGGVKKPANGVYGYDRWKGHANGIEQVIESLPVGVYTLSWDGGGTGTFGGVTSSSPLVAGWGSIANRSVVVPATATNVSLIAGDLSSHTANPFVARPPQVELALCQRYYETGRALLSSWAGSPQTQFTFSEFKQTKRVVPTITLTETGGVLNVDSTTTFPDTSGFQYTLTPTASGSLLRQSNTWSADAEL